MAHEGAHESLLRTPSSRAGSCGSQCFVDLPDAPHFNFRYMVQVTTSWDVLRTYLDLHAAQYGILSLSDHCIDVSSAVHPTPNIITRTAKMQRCPVRRILRVVHNVHCKR